MAKVTARNPAERQAAARLRAAAETGVPCAPVRDLIAPGDVEAAYRVQGLNVEAAIAGGARVVGRKVGLTSTAVQRQLGVDQPDFGVLFAHTCFGEGVPVPTGTLVQPRIEAEVAVILGRDLDVERPTVVDLVRAVDQVVPAFEIVASRIADWDITIVDTIADNASAGAFLLGGPYWRLQGLDLPAVEMSLRRRGEEVSSGTGRACLGNPLDAATWLAGRLAELGTPMRSGDIVLTGALGPMTPVQSGDEFEADFGAFGRVRAEFE